MKTHTFQKFLWFCLLLVSVMSHAEEAAEQWMPDANLRQAVREALELPVDEPLTKEKMLGFDSLSARYRDVFNITGLEFATNLRELYISQNPITDLRPLSNLTQLVVLHFWHYPANPTNLDLSPLVNLINLEELSLEGNGVSDISPLAGLRKLRELTLTNNRIEEVRSLMGFLNLEVLSLEANGITDINSLSKATNLRELHISQNPITDLRPLSNLTQLVVLHFWHYPANPTNLDLSPLANLINLEELSGGERHF